MEKQTFPMISR